jgi:outer membrane protein TolC
MRARSSAGALAASLCLAFPVSGAGQTLTLSEALDLASRNHPALSAAEARVTAAEGEADAARGARLPGVAATGALTRHQEPMVVAPLHSLNLGDPPDFDRTLIQSQLGVQYVVYDGGAMSSRLRAADADREATTHVLASTEMRVLEETITAYVRLSTARTVLAAARAQVAAVDAERERVDRHLEAGSAARVELLTAEAVLQEARAEEAASAAGVNLAERTLARLMGVDAAAVTERPLTPIDARGIPSDSGAETSPVVRRAEQSVTAAEARLAEARAGRLPTLRAAAGVLDYGAWESRHALEWRAGLELTWPIFTGTRGAAVRTASASVAAARADLEATRLETAQEIDRAATAISTADARADALATAVTQWEEVARIEALALEAGAGEQRDLLRAEAGVFQARAGYALATEEAIAARLRLARSRGVLVREWINEWTESP